jgi:hypothetical protein
LITPASEKVKIPTNVDKESRSVYEDWVREIAMGYWKWAETGGHECDCGAERSNYEEK